VRVGWLLLVIPERVAGPNPTALAGQPTRTLEAARRRSEANAPEGGAKRTRPKGERSERARRASAKDGASHGLANVAAAQPIPGSDAMKPRQPRNDQPLAPDFGNPGRHCTRAGCLLLVIPELAAGPNPESV